MKTVLIFAVLLVGCAASKPEPEGELRIRAHVCDGAGVSALVIEATGAGTATVHWDNKVCGTSV